MAAQNYTLGDHDWRRCTVCRELFKPKTKTSSRCEAHARISNLNALIKPFALAAPWIECAACGDIVESTHPNRRFCDSHARRWRVRICHDCGDEFATDIPKREQCFHCRGMTEVTRKTAPFTSLHWRQCQVCGVHLGFQNARAKTCNERACRQKVSSAYAWARAKNISKGQALKCWQRARQRIERRCRRCGKTFLSRFLSPKKYCSEPCEKAARKTVENAKRRARIKSGKKVRDVDPIKVFEREGWRCYICGTKTPQRLRGSTSPDAPELDHIVSLAYGGVHTYENTACCCRQCNIKKAEGWIAAGLIPKVISAPEPVHERSILWLGKTTGKTTVFERFGRRNRVQTHARI